MEKNMMKAEDVANEPATVTASNEAHSNETTGSTEAHEKRFGISDIWRIRRGARRLRIHNRIPRL